MALQLWRFQEGGPSSGRKGHTTDKKKSEPKGKALTFGSNAPTASAAPQEQPKPQVGGASWAKGAEPGDTVQLKLKPSEGEKEQSVSGRVDRIVGKTDPWGAPKPEDKWEYHVTVSAGQVDGDKGQRYAGTFVLGKGSPFGTITGKTKESNKPMSVLRIGPWDLKRETAGASTGVAQTRAASLKKKSGATDPSSSGSVDRATKESNKRMHILGRLREADSPTLSTQSGRRFRAVLLEEGMGNLNDCFFYTKEAIESCPPIFEGKKFFIDHPDAAEEQTRPERSVRDVAGWYENCAAEIDAQSGKTVLCADVVTINSPDVEPIRARLIECLNYQNKHANSDLLGFSINASGDFGTMGLEQFIKEAQFAPTCMPKLLEAQARGIQMIHPVSKMTTATSCDLVTEAGAGGRISQLLEREKGTMAKKESEKKEAEKKEAHKEDGAGAPPAKDGSADGAAGGAQHDDADADAELIQSMMKKYLGDGFTEDDKKMAMEAHQHAMEIGKAQGWDESEVEKAAGHFMQSHRHMQAKSAASAPAPDAPAPADAGAKPAAPQAGGQEADKKEAEKSQETNDDWSGKGYHPSAFAPGKTPSQAQHFESAKGKAPSKEVIELTAKAARLEAELEAERLGKHVETILRESNLPDSATARFRESIKDVKSKKTVDENFKIFREAWLAASSEDGMGGFIISQERQGAPALSDGTNWNEECKAAE